METYMLKIGRLRTYVYLLMIACAPCSTSANFRANDVALADKKFSALWLGKFMSQHEHCTSAKNDMERIYGPIGIVSGQARLTDLQD